MKQRGFDAASVLETTEAPRTTPPPLHSWFAVGLSGDLPIGAVRRGYLAGREIVLFRGESGAVGAVDSYCPHLGAHLGHGGRVAGDTIVCPFHAFRFDRGGTCVATGYGTKPPQRARLRAWAVCERAGFVLVWHGATETPRWEIPEVDHAGWTSMWRREFDIAGSPHDTVENTFDYGHLPLVHDYQEFREREPIRVEGHRFTVGWSFTRTRGLMSRGSRLESEVDVDVHGFGWSVVRTRVPSLDFHLRHYLLGTPTSPGRMRLRIGLEARFGNDRSGLLRAIPARTLASLAMPFAWRGFVADLRQDFPIWANKRFVESPALAAGDGPIGVFRRWARQFYAPIANATAETESLITRSAQFSP